MWRDTLFNGVLSLTTYLLIGVVVAVFLTLLVGALPSISHFGLSFFSIAETQEWNPAEQIYGVAPFVFGTLVTATIALLLSLPFSIAIALYLGEYSDKNLFSKALQTMVELLAGVPSVVYGLWGIFFLLPHTGTSVLTASLILALMIIPYTASVAREVILMVPQGLKEAAYSLGSTRLEVIIKVILPYAFSGIFAGILLSFGRALGETMAVTMLIGNNNSMPDNLRDFSPLHLFDPHYLTGLGNTIASVIANEFNEADGLLLSSLFEMGLILFFVSLLINTIGRLIILRVQHKREA